jgi:hypothetical protein
MKYTAAAASLLAAAASAAAVPRQDYSTVYKVTNFSAACIAHSVQCAYVPTPFIHPLIHKY